MRSTFLARGAIATALAGLLAAGAHAGPLDSSVALDQAYIPALALTTAAQGDAGAVEKARGALQRLQVRWPALRAALLQDLSSPGPTQATAARQTLAQVDRHLATAAQAVTAANYKAAHEALEEVRIELMHARTARGMDYFVDRLTAYHEPMEVLALAGSGTPSQEMTAARRGQLEAAFVQARALWHGIEQHLPHPQDYQLNDARSAQFRRGVAEETAALGRLSQALRGSDDAALLKAAAAVKPPFARTFTAFGQAD